jgi:diacylglycerol kinase (ATP)
MRIALIANPASGGGLDVDALVEALRRHGAEVRAFGLEHGDLAEAAAWGPERVAVAGGDGTIAPCAELAGRLGVALAVIPSGTANDFARASGLPPQREQACKLAATGGELSPHELGRLADGHPFVNVASAGLASAAAHRAKPLKPRLGPLAYLVGALRAAASEQPLGCTVRADGDEVFHGDAWQVIVAVTGAFGGGSELGAAEPDDGVLDIALLPAGSRAGLARRAWGLRRGTIAAQRDVCHTRGSVVEVALPEGEQLNVDGEVREGGLERVTVEPHAFSLVVG